MKVLLLLLANGLVTVTVFQFGLHSGLQMVFYPLAVIPLMVFNLKDRLKLGFTVLLPLLSFFAFTQVPLQQGMLHTFFPLQGLSMFLSFGVLLSGMFFFKLKNNRVESLLIEQTERFNQVAKTVDEVFWICDHQLKKMLYVSPSIKRLVPLHATGPDQVLKEWLNFVHSEDRAKVLTQMFSKEGQSDFEYRMVHPETHEMRWMKSKSYSVTDQNDSTIGIGVIQEITELRVAQLELEHEQARIVTATHLALLGEMSGGIALEMVAPLKQMKLMAEQFKLGKIRENCESMQEAVGQIANKVFDFETIVRSDGSRDMQFYPVKWIIDETLALCGERLKSHGLELKIDSFSEESMVYCKVSELEQVVLRSINDISDLIRKTTPRTILLKVGYSKERVEIKIGAENIDLHDPSLSDLNFKISKEMIESQGGQFYSLSLGVESFYCISLKSS